ncbi:MAG: endolytic transglycosylase MltG [Pseudomonadota bacterium]|nr:endolytic transglycosylase MltG [Pseudomonadota bacterium]
MKRLLIAFLCLLLAASGLLAYGLYYYYNAPGPLVQDTTLIFKHGEGFRAVTDDMAAAGVIERPLMFKALAVLTGEAPRFKAGEYHFSAAVTPRQAMGMLAEGRVVVHKITIPEGLNVREALSLLAQEPALEGSLPENIPEGSLLPETYHFTYGDKRQDIVDRMQAGMASLLASLWQKRKPGLPFANPEQALTLASIVEKETGLDSERGRVAAVFINRLKRGMKLQSDPTVAYGMERQAGRKLDRTLTLDDLHQDTPYNTYVIPGLPPGPIANPGRAALEATLNPPDTNDLYFVATGAGGHNFSSTLQGHNKNVQQYRETVTKKAP